MSSSPFHSIFTNQAKPGHASTLATNRKSTLRKQHLKAAACSVFSGSQSRVQRWRWQITKRNPSDSEITKTNKGAVSLLGWLTVRVAIFQYEEKKNQKTSSARNVATCMTQPSDTHVPICHMQIQISTCMCECVCARACACSEGVCLPGTPVNCFTLFLCEPHVVRERGRERFSEEALVLLCWVNSLSLCRGFAGVDHSSHFQYFFSPQNILTLYSNLYLLLKQKS